MEVILTDSYEEMSRAAAQIFAAQLYTKPASVIGLATGSTQLLFYEKLVQVNKAGLDFSQAVTFNLDEYIGLNPKNEQSYHYFMVKNFFSKVKVRPRNIDIPNGMASNIEEEGRSYDQAIEAAGGIDVQFLGIGRNAHIGFNEPDVKFEATTHQVRLDEATINANSRFFAREADVPRYAISMGMKNIMLAAKIVLLASGRTKADAVYKAVCGSISPEAPASILQLHRDVVVIADRKAGAFLPASVLRQGGLKR